MAYLSYLMMIAGLAIVGYVLKQNYDIKKGTLGVYNNDNNDNISHQFASSTSPRMEAQDAANSIEFSSRISKINTNSLDSIQLALATAEGGFDRNGHNDMLASSMVAESVGKHIPIAEGDILLTPEYRRALMKDFANTHLGKIASFTHSISSDGKLIVSADAIGFLTSEYDPILMPGGLIAIVVKNEIEAELYKALQFESPIFIQNKDSEEVSRIDYDSIKKIVKSGNIDDLLVESNKYKELFENTKDELSNIRKELSDEKAKCLRLESQNVVLHDALSVSQNSYENIQKLYADYKTTNEVKSEAIVIKNPTESAQTFPVKTKVSEVTIETKSEGSVEPQIIPTVVPEIVPEVIVKAPPVNTENVRKLSSIITDVFAKAPIDSYLNTPSKWADMAICFVYIEENNAHVYVEKTMLSGILNGRAVILGKELYRRLHRLSTPIAR
jgi:hypothetical protein